MFLAGSVSLAVAAERAQLFERIGVAAGARGGIAAQQTGGAAVVPVVPGSEMLPGFTDAQRAMPPPVGSWLTYRYNGLTSTGLPRFARFLRVRDEMPPPE